MCLFWAPLFCTVIDAICGTYFYDVFYFDHKSGMAKMDKLKKESGLGFFDKTRYLCDWIIGYCTSVTYKVITYIKVAQGGNSMEQKMRFETFLDRRQAILKKNRASYEPI